MEKQIKDIKQKVVRELESLPNDKVRQVADFIGYLKSRETKMKRWDMLCVWGKKFAKEKGLKKSSILKEAIKSRYTLG